MVINGLWSGRALTLSTKPNCLTISLAQPAGAQVWSYDLAGRLWTAMVDGVSYRRGLNGKLVAKWQTAGQGRERRWLSEGEARGIEAQAHSLVCRLQVALQGGEVFLEADLPAEARQALDQAVAFDAARARADIAQYHQVYKPVGILPPDQYMAVVLQATQGCAFNTCTFCSFYKDRPFRIKSPDEFQQHAGEVRQFLGEGLSLRRTIFLGDANALVIPMPRLLPLVEIVHEIYDVEQLGGMYAFLDGFSGVKKDRRDYQLLAERGLKRVYVGLESGNEALLRFLKKPGKPGDAVHAIQAMKAAGVPVGVIILLGAGGKKYARQHILDTIEALNSMRLDADDLIYFSELVVNEGMDYVKDAYQAGLAPLSEQERSQQAEVIERGLSFSAGGGVPHISRYDIREFVY